MWNKKAFSGPKAKGETKGENSMLRGLTSRCHSVGVFLVLRHSYIKEEHLQYIVIVRFNSTLNILFHRTNNLAKVLY